MTRNKPTAKPEVLKVENLRVEFDRRRGPPLTVLHGVDLALHPGEVLGVVGESGCGKSTLALAVMRLITQPPGRIAAGRVLLSGRDLLSLPEREMRRVRGREIGMIFQEPLTSLNPVYTVGDQISEVMQLHLGLGRSEGFDRAHDLLDRLHIPDAAGKLRSYPHQLSGGMRQRIMIAIALACEPALLLADEPTTALDVTIQAQIFDLLREIGSDRRSMVLITHDFGVIAELADRVVVMYAGHKVEEGSVREIVLDPRHPYTHGLLRCIPDISAAGHYARGALPVISGTVPNLADPPVGCPFAPRCDRAMSRCAKMPPFFELGPGRGAACWLLEPEGEIAA